MDRNPWDNAIQFKTNVLDLDDFPPDSGFEAAFRFEAEGGGHLSSLKAVVERPDIFDVEINGTAIRALPDQWWLDKGFGVFPVGPLVRSGENTIVIKARPFSIHAELESIYILGDFRLEAESRGFVVVPPAPLHLGPWNEQGLPFYPSGVSYRRDYDIPETEKGRDRYTVELEDWGGAVAEVRVNGDRAGLIAFPPYALDITEALRPGRAVITVSVLGTLRNTLGPHHNRPPLGKAWPRSFQKGAAGGLPEGEAYDFLPYGLFTDFKLVRHLTDKN
jgi:hypothetical protein